MNEDTDDRVVHLTMCGSARQLRLVVAWPSVSMPTLLLKCTMLYNIVYNLEL